MKHSHRRKGKIVLTSKKKTHLKDKLNKNKYPVNKDEEELVSPSSSAYLQIKTELSGLKKDLKLNTLWGQFYLVFKLVFSLRWKVSKQHFFLDGSSWTKFHCGVTKM